MIKGTSEGHGFPKNECFTQKHENSITDITTTNMIQSAQGDEMMKYTEFTPKVTNFP
jgi:hypothetical protein